MASDRFNYFFKLLNLDNAKTVKALFWIALGFLGWIAYIEISSKNTDCSTLVKQWKDVAEAATKRANYSDSVALKVLNDANVRLEREIKQKEMEQRRKDSLAK